MVSAIAGSLIMLFGLAGFINPAAFGNRLRRKLTRRMNFVVYPFILILIVVIAGDVMRARTLFVKIAGIAGLIITVKFVMLIGAASSGKLAAWLNGRSRAFFRICAIVIFAFGLFLFYASRY